MTLKAALLHSNDDGFSLGVELLRATVQERVAGGLEHRVWFHPPVGDLSNDYLGQYNRLMARLFSWRPDVVAFSVYVWNHEEFARLSQLVKRHLPDSVVVWGGAQVSSRRMAAHLLETCPSIDLVLRGEAEDSYPQLLAALRDGGDLGGVRGLSWRCRQQPRHNEDAAKVDLRTVPLVFDPARMDLRTLMSERRTRTVAYETGRGCRQSCRFCLYGLPALRAFDLDRVERELGYILRARPPFLRICDAHFGISRPRAMEIFDVIAAHNEDTAVEIYPDTRHVDREYVAAMNRSGCRVVSLGIQSSDAGTLELSRRRFDAQTFARAARLIRSGHNRELAADVIIGLPGDDYARVESSIRFAFEHGVSRVHFAPLMAFPGTEFYEHADLYGLEFMPFQPPLAVESPGFPASDYQRAMILAARIERLQDEVPTLLRCVLAVPADPVDLVRDWACEVDDTPLPLAAELPARIAACWPAQAAFLLDGLSWDRCRLQQARAALLLTSPRDDDPVEEAGLDRMLTLSVPMDQLIDDPLLSRGELPTGEYRFVFPAGGRAAYPVVGPLAAALDALRPGETFGGWRARLRSDGGPAAGRLADEAIEVLLAAGVVRAGRPAQAAVPS
ncbi:MAG: B12-binding domain-containing radical SAM protein [Mycobacteriales bacterium]